MQVPAACRHRRRRDRRLVRRECADRTWPCGVGLRAGCGARGDRGRRVSHAQQRTPPAKDGTGIGGGEMGRACRSRFALFPPRRSADRAGSGDGLLGLERDIRNAPRRPRCDAGRCPAGRRRAHRASLHRLRAERRPGAGVVRQWRLAPKPTSSSRRTASIPSFGRMCSRPRSRCSRDPSRIGAWCRMSAFRIGRSTAGKCGSARESTSWPFPVRAGKLINYVGFVPADEEMKESWSAPGDPDVLRREFAGWDPRIAAPAEGSSADLPLGAV